MPIIRGSDRDKLYKSVAKLVGKIPLYKIQNIAVPNNCKIFCKEEYEKNPTGSHYDRFWVDYLRRQEDQHRFSTKDILIETSTGNSGASFAWACRTLHFQEYHVVIPEDMPTARIRQILKYGATIYTSPPERYVEGLIETFDTYVRKIREREQKKSEKERRRVKLPNHSRSGQMSLGALAKIAEESILQLEELGIKRLDYFVTALGNGLSTKAIGERLKVEYPSIKLIGIEAAQSPTVHAKLNPGKEPPATVGKTHGLIGTSPGGDPTIFPIMDSYSSNLNDVVLIEESEWNNASIQLSNLEGKLVGHTSAASFHQAMKIAEGVKEKNILIVFYAPDWKYS